MPSSSRQTTHILLRSETDGARRVFAAQFRKKHLLSSTNNTSNRNNKKSGVPVESGRAATCDVILYAWNRENQGNRYVVIEKPKKRKYLT